MIPIPIEEVPRMEVTEIINNECVAFMVVPEGVLVHYLERDCAGLITWEDIIGIGVEGMDAAKPVTEKEDAVREIERPVMP